MADSDEIPGYDKTVVNVKSGSTDAYAYAVFSHTANWAVGAGGALQLGGYFQDQATLTTALQQWAQNGWTIPNIAVAWEQFTLDGKPTWGFRIRNGGAPVIVGTPGMSVVVAVTRISGSMSRPKSRIGKKTKRGRFKASRSPSRTR